MRGLNIFLHPSPNFGRRRHGRGPDMVVLHHTAMRDAASALARLCDPAAEVSCHYLIDERGHIFRLVDEALRAWHAGAGRWGRVEDVNSHSIGIELANPGPLKGHPPYAAPQMDALELLLGDILKRHRIAPQAVIAHSDMAPGRKADPGAGFDWRRLALRGLSVWCAPGEQHKPDEAAFLEQAAAFGYPVGEDIPTHAILDAFRLRFRPRHQGPLDGDDMAIIMALAQTYPCRLGP